jgi:hypothetical protein
MDKIYIASNMCPMIEGDFLNLGLCLGCQQAKIDKKVSPPKSNLKMKQFFNIENKFKIAISRNMEKYVIAFSL